MPFPELMAPFIPQEPQSLGRPGTLEDVIRWAVEMRRELDRFLVEVHRHAATKSLVGTRAEVTVTAEFSLRVEDVILCLTAASAVTSSDTTALQDGADGQWVILINVGTETITVKHGANTHLGLSADLDLAQYECLHLAWTGALWVEVV